MPSWTAKARKVPGFALGTGLGAQGFEDAAVNAAFHLLAPRLRLSGLNRLVIPDGKSYIYNARRTFSELYLVSGLN